MKRPSAPWKDGLVWAATTITTVFNVHRGAALPAARIIVIAVPATAAILYWYLIGRHRGGSR